MVGGSSRPDSYKLTASEAAAEIRAGILTVEEYALSLLARVEERDSKVKAWAYLDREHVLKQARLLDEVPVDKRGPLHGVAVGVKDVIYTKGMGFDDAVSGTCRYFRLTTRFRHANSA